MKITVGMAHMNDFDGAIFTIQALALYHSVPDMEILVVDNSPNTPAGKELAKSCQMWPKRGSADIRYIAMPESQGTTQPRQRVFDEARGEIVVCVDCHVMFVPGAIRRLVDYFNANPQSRDLVSGPILFSNLGTATHFDPYWRAEMYGIWSTAWSCAKCKRGRFADREVNGKVVCADVMTGTPLEACPLCSHPFPHGLGWPAHEQKFIQDGFRPSLLDNEPFEIPGQGLGAFACRKEAWLGFNPHFRGFGGEELYIHAKFRKAGAKCLLLPFMGWWHRFERVGNPPYPVTRWNKVRNYVLGRVELGLPLDDIYEHFVASNLFPKEEWEELIADPVNTVMPRTAPAAVKASTQGQSASKIPPEWNSFDAIAKFVKDNPRDLNEHVDRIIKLVSECDSVVSVVKRREWDAAVLAGRPRVYYSDNREQDLMTSALHQLVATVGREAGKRPIEKFTSSIDGLEKALEYTKENKPELLILDTVPSGANTYDEMKKFSPYVTRWILLRGTGAFGERAENDASQPGMLFGLRRFLKEHPEWSVLDHYQNQYGITVVGCRPEDRPKLPSKIQMAANLAKALSEHVMDGLNKVSEEQLEERLNICTTCPHRADQRCSVCGCFLSAKATMRSAVCPLGYWPDPGTGTLTSEASNDHPST